MKILLLAIFMLSACVSHGAEVNDENIIRQYYENGNLFRECSLKNSIIDGIRRKFYINDMLYQEISYRNGRKNGLAKIFSPQGNLTEEIYYIDGKEEGLAKIYFENGLVYWDETYKNGLLNGESRVYYEDGTLFIKMNWSSGELDGPFRAYDTKGTLMKELFYRKGVLFDKKGRPINGWVIFKYDNDQIFIKDFYQNGIREGLSYLYDETGTLRELINYKNGRKNGLRKIYYNDGRLKEEVYALEHEDIIKIVYDKQGNVVLVTGKVLDGDNLDDYGFENLPPRRIAIKFVYRLFQI